MFIRCSRQVYCTVLDSQFDEFARKTSGINPAGEKKRLELEPCAILVKVSTERRRFMFEVVWRNGIGQPSDADFLGVGPASTAIVTQLTASRPSIGALYEISFYFFFVSGGCQAWKAIAMKSEDGQGLPVKHGSQGRHNRSKK
jgi:hypothetical protein